MIGELMSKSIRVYLAALIAIVVLLALLPVGAFAHANSGNIRPSDETIKSLAQKYLNERNRVMVSSNPNSNNRLNVPMTIPSEMSQKVAARQSGDVEKLRDVTKRIENKGSYYWNRFDTNVKIEKTTVEKDKTVTRIYEYTRLYFAPGKGREGEYSSFDAERDFTFAQNQGNWEITDVQLVDPGTLPPPNEPSVTPPLPTTQPSPEDIKLSNSLSTKALSSRGEPNGQQASSVPLSASLNATGGQAIIDYCNMYTDNSGTNSTAKYNKQWYNVYSDDCQNFASQALHYAAWPYAGAPPTNNYNVWYCPNKTPSNTFINCFDFQMFCAHTGWGKFTADYNDLRVGDIIQIDQYNQGLPSHTLIVFRAGSGNYRNVRLAAHTNNRLNWPLESLLAMVPNTTHTYWLIRTGIP